MESYKFTTHAVQLSNAFGMLFPAEVLQIYLVAHKLPRGATCVNFGAGFGTSALALIENRPDLAPTTWTFDISSGGPYGGMENERNAFSDAGIPHLLPHQVISDSAQAGRDWKGGPVDYLFVDGDHSEDALAADIAAWLPHMRRGGYVLYHDYDRDAWPAVKRVVDGHHPRLLTVVDTLAVVVA